LNDASYRFFLQPGDDFIDANAEVIVEHQHLTARDEPVVDEDVDRSRRACPVPRPSLAEFEHILNKHPAAAQLDLHAQFDITQQIDAGDLGILHHLLEIGQFEGMRIRSRGASLGNERLEAAEWISAPPPSAAWLGSSNWACLSKLVDSGLIGGGRRGRVGTFSAGSSKELSSTGGIAASAGTALSAGAFGWRRFVAMRHHPWRLPRALSQ